MLLLLMGPQKNPQGLCHRCHLFPGSRRQGPQGTQRCAAGSFENIAMATTAETAKSPLSSIVGIGGMSSLTFLQQGGPLGTDCTEVCIQREGLPLSKLPFLFCVSEIGRKRPTFANDSSCTTSPVRENVDPTMYQLKSPRVKSRVA